MINYCLSCLRVFKLEDHDSCPHCHSTFLRELKKDTPVNVMGTKIKGRVFKLLDDTALLIVITEHKEKLIKEYPINKLKKILK